MHGRLHPAFPSAVCGGPAPEGPCVLPSGHELDGADPSRRHLADPTAGDRARLVLDDPAGAQAFGEAGIVEDEEAGLALVHDLAAAGYRIVRLTGDPLVVSRPLAENALLPLLASCSADLPHLNDEDRRLLASRLAHSPLRFVTPAKSSSGA